eukprot:6186561-Pleurochrysis_carterae.AAC.1
MEVQPHRVERRSERHEGLRCGVNADVCALETSVRSIAEAMYVLRGASRVEVGVAPLVLRANTSKPRMHMTNDLSAESALMKVVEGGGRVELVDEAQLPMFILLQWPSRENDNCASRVDFTRVHQSIPGQCLLGQRGAGVLKVGSRRQP